MNKQTTARNAAHAHWDIPVRSRSSLPRRMVEQKQVQSIHESLKGALSRPRAMRQQLLTQFLLFLENLSQQDSTRSSFFFFLFDTASESQHVKLWTILHCGKCFAEIAWQDCQKDYLLIFFVLGFISANNGARKGPSVLKTEFIHESYAAKLFWTSCCP